MKKRMLRIAAIMAVLSLGMTACGSSTLQDASSKIEVDTSEKDTSVQEEEVSEATEVSEEQEISDIENMKEQYGIIVEKYLTAITDQWTMEELEENFMSSLVMNHYEKGVDSVGVTGNYDLDNDGTSELLIGELSDEETDHMVYAAYTMKDGEAVPVFISSERNRYYLIELLENDPMAVNVYNVGSNGASNSFNIEYTVDKDQLNVVQAIVYDDSKNPDKPWYMSYDNDLNLANAESIDEKDALAIIDANDSNIGDPSYVPLTMGFLYKESVESPIYDVSLDELLKATNLSLLPVEGAEDVNYAIIDQGSKGKMAEMNFIMDGKNYCYRAMITNDISPFDTSGLYYKWDVTEDVKVNYCDATYESCDDASAIYWLDVVPGVVYSLSVIQPTEKSELVDLANQIFVPTQGDS